VFESLKHIQEERKKKVETGIGTNIVLLQRVLLSHVNVLSHNWVW